MIVTVKYLTNALDNEIGYVMDAKKSGKATNEYVDMMYSKINAKFKELKRISSNKKLVNKYLFMIQDVFYN